MSAIKDLPITKEQFIEGTLKFTYQYKRLPFLNGDDIEAEVKNKDDELELRPFRASRYIVDYFESQDNMAEELFKEDLITYKMISDITGITETILRNAITKETKNPELSTRRAIHIFFNRDYYSELGKLAKKCESCKGCKCEYEYWTSVVHCPNYKKK